MSSFRPRSAAEIADATIQLMRRHYGALLPLSALVAIPSVVLGFFTSRLQPTAGVSLPGPATIGVMIAVFVVAMLWWFVSAGALVAVAQQGYLGEQTEPAAGLRRAMGEWGRLIGANLLAYLAAAIVPAVAIVLMAVVMPKTAADGAASGGSVGLAFVLFLAAFVGMIYSFVLFARFVLVTPIVLAEPLGASATIARAWRLSKGFTRRTIGLLIVAFIIYGAVLLSVMGLLGTVIHNQQIVSGLSSLVAVPLYPAWSCLLTVLYYDLRIRKEGYDIELMARGVGGAPAGITAGEGAPGPESFGRDVGTAVSR